MIGVYKETWDDRDFDRFEIGKVRGRVCLLADEPFPAVSHIVSFANPPPIRIRWYAWRKNVPVTVARAMTVPSSQPASFAAVRNLFRMEEQPVRCGESLEEYTPVRDRNVGYVFVDQAIGIDPEETVDGIHIDREQYKASVIRFLDKVREMYRNNRVVVLAHPRTSEASFGDYPVIHHATNDMIAASLGVIGHFSTALGVAIRCRKPMILLTTPELESAGFGRYILGLAREILVPVHTPDVVPQFYMPMNVEEYEAKHLNMGCPTFPELIDRLGQVRP